MSSIMKGIVDESEEVAVIYIDNKPSTKYAKKHEAERDAEFLRNKYPNKKIEIKHEVRETEAKKGADGKRCWKGKRYAGTVNGKDKCIPVKEESDEEALERLKNNKSREKWMADADLEYMRKRHSKNKPVKNESAYEKDLADNEPRIVSGVYGAKSKEFRKKFANQRAQDRFFDHPDREGNYEIHYVQKLDEAKTGTPGGIEMFRTPSMVNATMQQNLYKRDLEAINKAKEAEKRKEYRKNNPKESIPVIHIGAYSYPITVFQSWKDNRDVGEAIKYAVNKFANKQSKEFKDSLAADPEFRKAVEYFFEIGEQGIDARSAAIAKLGPHQQLNTDYRPKELTSAGFDAIRKITNVVLNYMKKFGVDKTGRRVPSGFNYALEESVSENTYDIGQQLMDIALEIKELADSAMRLVRGTPEEGRARSYWYPHIVMAVSDDHGYMGKNMATMSGSAEALMNGEDEEYMDEARAPHPLLKAANKNLVDLASGEVRRKEDAKKAAAKREREYAKQAARAAKPKKPTLDQIWQRVEHAISNYFPDGDPTDYLNPYMERNNLTWDDITRAAKRNGYKDLWDYWNTLSQDIENDAYYDWQAAKRPEAPKNPLSKDAADIQHRDWVAKKNPQIRARAPFMEDPDTSGPVGTQPGGWRKTTESRSSILKGIGRAR